MLKNINIGNDSIDYVCIEELNISISEYISTPSTEFIDLIYLLYTDVYIKEFI